MEIGSLRIVCLDININKHAQFSVAVTCIWELFGSQPG